MRRKRLAVLLLLSAVMAVLLIFAELGNARKTEEDNRRYMEEHSLFEDIVVGAGSQKGTAASGSSLKKTGGGESDSSLKNAGGGETDSFLKNAGGVETAPSLNAGGETGRSSDTPGNSAYSDADTAAREEWEEEKTTQAPAAGQETFLTGTEDGKWILYAAADFADSACLYFEKFQTLRLSRTEETSPDSPDAADPAGAGSGIYTLHSGDNLPQPCMKNGSVWHAQLLGKNEEILEEGEIVLYCAGGTATLYINTETGSLDAVNADKSVRENCRYLFCRADGTRDSWGKCQIHGRGNSSWKEDKKQYSINLSSERSVLGMESSRKFALIANTSDPSYLRNRITYDLAALTGMPAAPQTAYVNVYFNGRYHGLYLLAQRPNAKGGSVHIAPLEKQNRDAAGQGAVTRETSDDPETVTVIEDGGLEIHASPVERIPDNISGGYLLEMDARYEDEDYWFSTNRHHFVVKYPEAVPLEECRYIAGYLREAEAALYNEDGINPDTGKSWDQYFDTSSWAAMYLMQDFMAQWDVESFSFFVYKDAEDPLLYCGPVWDFDLSMGATGLGKLPNVMRQSIWLRDHREGWLTELEKFPAFTDALETFAREDFFPLLEEYLSRDSDLPLPGFEDCREILASSVKMDVVRWGESDQFEQESARVLSWLQDRAEFWQGMRNDPSAYCRVTLRYGFNDMDIYLPRGQAIGFVPTEEYGEHLYSSFRKKYGSIDGWRCEDGSLLTPQTVIDHDQVMIPFSQSE